MSCLDATVEKAKNEVNKKWSGSETLQKWGLTDDLNFFKELFYEATGKDLDPGNDFSVSDMKKVGFAIDDLKTDLKSKTGLSNIFAKALYIGKALARKNPFIKDFYETLRNASTYRQNQSNEMLSSYKNMMKFMKMAILEFDGVAPVGTWSLNPGNIRKKMLVNKRFKKLNEKEKAYYLKMKSGENVGLGEEWGALKSFLDNEGSVFSDFITLVEGGGDISQTLLKNKYADSGPHIGRYLDRLSNAASSWVKIQRYSREQLINGIKNAEYTALEKYGDSKVADRYIEQFKELRKNLEMSEDNFIPHYVLDLLGESEIMRERLNDVDFNMSEGKDTYSQIMNDFANKAKAVNLKITDRLKGKSMGEGAEVFSRNPMLYATKYIADVVRWNHVQFVDRAYVKALNKLTSVPLDAGDKNISEAMESYVSFITDMHQSATGKNSIEESSTGRNLYRFMTSVQFIMKLGLSMKSAVKNKGQRLLEVARFGTKAVKDANQWVEESAEGATLLSEVMDQYGIKFMDLSRVTEGSAVTPAELESFGIDMDKGMLTYGDRTILQKLTKITQKGADWTSKNNIVTTLTRGAVGKSLTMAHAETWNRQGTFKTAFYVRFNQLRQLRKNNGIHFAKDTEGNFIDQRAQAVVNTAGRFAAKNTSLLHFDYELWGKSKLLGSKTGGSLYQFKHFQSSYIDLMNQVRKKTQRALAAGDFAGDEVQQALRYSFIYAAAELGSVVGNVNFTQYIDNDLLNSIKSVLGMLNGLDEEEMEEFGYGKGLLPAAGIQATDLMSFYNWGAAAGYWRTLADQDSAAGWALGMRDHGRATGAEAIEGISKEITTEPARLWYGVAPSLAKGGIVDAFRAEFGVWPGTTSMGIDTKKARQAVKDYTFNEYSMEYLLNEKDKKRLNKNKNLTTQQRNSALRAMREADFQTLRKSRYSTA